MKNNNLKILGISGSLRESSSASGVLKVVAGLMPGNVDFEMYNDLEKIPAFNDSNEIPLPVSGLIDLITAADGVFFCIPEYAFGVPGALKNALDWTVSSTAFSDKPVALITAASQGQKAHAALLLTLSAIGTKINEGSQLVISFIRIKLDEKNNLKDDATMHAIKSLIKTFLESVEEITDPDSPDDV